MFSGNKPLCKKPSYDTKSLIASTTQQHTSSNQQSHATITMTNSPQPRLQECALAKQDSRLSSAMDEDENQEDSSGSGSGAGYSADYESSESSLSSKQKNELQQREGTLKDATNDESISSSSKNAVDFSRERRHKKSHGAKKSCSENSLEHTNSQLQALLPQWNGIRIEHPMDPRIDLSTVGYTLDSNKAAAAVLPAIQQEAPNQHSIDHYLHLMEVRLFIYVISCAAVSLFVSHSPCILSM